MAHECRMYAENMMNTDTADCTADGPPGTHHTLMHTVSSTAQRFHGAGGQRTHLEQRQGVEHDRGANQQQLAEQQHHAPPKPFALEVAVQLLEPARTQPRPFNARSTCDTRIQPPSGRTHNAPTYRLRMAKWGLDARVYPSPLFRSTWSTRISLR